VFSQEALRGGVDDEAGKGEGGDDDRLSPVLFSR
jgi:hypothetical protein